RRRDGTSIDVEVSSTLLRVEGQRLVQGICRDVSARKRTEEALRRAEEALREERDFVAQVLETADALIMVADASGRVLRFNGKCTAVSGFREEEARRRLFWDFLLPDPADERGPDTFACLRSGPARPLPGGPSTGAFESLWRTRSGAERLIVWRI